MSYLGALGRKNRCYWRNTGRILREQSRLKVLFILGFAVMFEVGLALLFLDGFRFLDSLGGAGTIIINRLFALFYLAIGVMTIMSSLIITYSTFFRSAEIPFLLSSPLSLYEVMTYKFFESTALCSWSFFFIMVPFLAAFAHHERLSPWFAVWNMVFSIPFLCLCAGAGTVMTMLVVRWFPRRNRWARTGLLVIVIVTSFMALRNSWTAGLSDDLQFNLAALLPGLSLASARWAPSWWVAEGVLALARDEWGRGIMLLFVVCANAALLLLLVQELGNRTFSATWQLVSVGSGLKGRRALLFPMLARPLQRLDPGIRGLVLKDIRTFFRDPMQWSQALIFFGILALYFSNLRSFRYHLLPDTWRNTIAFLNVFSVTAVMCSLGSRFVYPQLSLEGQAFWVIGLSPLTPVRILLTKFCVSVAALLPVGVILMTLSSLMLRADIVTTCVAMLLACCMSAAITGLSTGLGAIYMDLRQRNPAAIVSGFGGTLNLVMSLGLMLTTIVPVGTVLHLRNLGVLSETRFALALAAVLCWLVVASAAGTIIPLVLGCRSLRRREF